MGLNEKYDTLNFPAAHYIYIEKIGSFLDTAPKAWQELHQLKDSICKENEITQIFSMYRMEKNLYRAGFAVSKKPEGKLVAPLKYEHFEGGPYMRFVLTGSYMQLPKACSRVMDIVHKEKLKTTDNFYLERYLNDPQTTEESQLKTEILIPTQL